MKEIFRAAHNNRKYGKAENANIGYTIEEIPSLTLLLVGLRLWTGQSHALRTHRVDITVDGALEGHKNIWSHGPFAKTRLKHALKNAKRYAKLRAENIKVYEPSKEKLAVLGIR